jgi:hypothetical protein
MPGPFLANRWALRKSGLRNRRPSPLPIGPKRREGWRSQIAPDREGGRDQPKCVGLYAFRAFLWAGEMCLVNRGDIIKELPAHQVFRLAYAMKVDSMVNFARGPSREVRIRHAASDSPASHFDAAGEGPSSAVPLCSGGSRSIGWSQGRDRDDRALFAGGQRPGRRLPGPFRGLRGRLPPCSPRTRRVPQRPDG